MRNISFKLLFTSFILTFSISYSFTNVVENLIDSSYVKFRHSPIDFKLCKILP